MRTLLISLLCVLSGVEETLAVPSTREFYIAAVEIGWDYLYWGSADPVSEQRRRTKEPPQKYIKAVYREYTDSTYSVPKPTPTWAGIQGPVIHAQASDRVVVHFKNLASQPYSISPVGVSYWKQSEGAGYDDATSSQEKEDDAVAPGGYYKYIWDINPNDGPTLGDPECLTYSYSSQVDTVQDFNSGLIGALLICKSTAFTDNGVRKSREFILLFAVFDESKSWYGEVGSFRERFKKASARKQYHTINGYVNSTLPGLTMCQGRDHVFWHLIGMETSPEIHSIQFQDHTLQVMDHRKVTVEMTPMTFTTAEMKPSTQGKFLISCQIQEHRHAGMSAFFKVEDCPEPVTVPGPDVRQVQQSEDKEDYEYGDDMFETFVFKPGKDQAVGRSRGGKIKIWVHYIAAEEIIWDYAPHLSQGDSQLLSEYFPRGPHQLGHEYKKVVYVEYTDQTFTKRKSPVKRLLGPLLRGQVDEHFQIVFKNLASRPFNMYPNGLTTISPLRKTGNEGEKDLRSLAVPPNGTYGYMWKLTAEDGPLERDPQCLTRLYQSTINPERDVATGLVGPLLICKKDSMDTRGRLVGPDKVKQLMFAVFDENKSWNINDNIQKYSRDPSMVNPTDPDFYNSNVIYNVNGIMFNGQMIQLCKDDVTFWHLANVGTQSDFLSVYFTGNPFMRDNVYESVLTLFPMSGETVTMETELIGEWEISAFDSSLKSRGMSARYSVLSCNIDLLVDNEDLEYGLEDVLPDYVDQFFKPRSLRPRLQNRTVAIRVCKKQPSLNQNTTRPKTRNYTDNEVAIGESGDHGSDNNVTFKAGDQRSICEVRYVTVLSADEEGNLLSQGGIPTDVLKQLEKDGEWKASETQEGGGLGGEQGGKRQRRQARVEGGDDGEEVEEGGLGREQGGKRQRRQARVEGGEDGEEVEEGGLGREQGGKRQRRQARVEGGEDGEEVEEGGLGREQGGKRQRRQARVEGGEDGEEVEEGGLGREQGGKRQRRQARVEGGEDGEEVEEGGLGREQGGNGRQRLQASLEGGESNKLAENCEEKVLKEWKGRVYGEALEQEQREEQKVEVLDQQEEQGQKGELDRDSHPLSTYYTDKDPLLLELDGWRDLDPLKNTLKALPDQLKVQQQREEQKAGEVHPLNNNPHTDPDTPLLNLLDLDFSNVSNDNETAPRNAVSLEYDDYSEKDTGTTYMGTEDNLDLRTTDGHYRSYYIAAQEITWDYGIRKPHQLIKTRERRRGMRKFLTEYKKVVFRAYSERDFQIPVTRGELQEHLGLMGPIIKAEINDLLTVTFKNMASRPYSLHLHGVYDKTQGDGWTQTQWGSSRAGVAGVPGEAVQPGEVRVYTWRITRKQGPTAAEFDCKAGAYYSTQNKVKDLHSGLIGPLVICKPGTLHPQLNLQPNLQEYALLFHTFDETKSWYLDENIRQYCIPPCQARRDDPWFQLSNKFAAINGYVAETLPGLMVAQHQQVRWHLLNVGGDGEYHTAHFHGLPFSIHKEQEHRMGVYNLYPGVFGTVEMRPATVGTWMVECTVGEHQLAGMRAKLLVYNPRCIQPLGLRSGRIDDSQITASDHIGNWEARLARLELSGSVNAWMGTNQKSWIQVDLQRPTLLHGIQTQGARASLGLKDYFIVHFTLSYSLDQETWTNYRGNSTTPSYIFNGNLDGSKVKENHMFPPILGRYIRLQPVTIQRNPALRMELLGCDLNSCSFPLGLQRRLVPDSSFRASSFLQTWRLSWSPALARLRQDGSANAWRPKVNNPHEWLQVDLLVMKRITGVVTQGAWSILTQMMVTEFSVTISDEGHSWSNVVDEESQREKMFLGNSEPDEEMLNLFDPPLFARFIRIHPRGWVNDIALRLEFVGCDTQQRL
ncbi:coagulation factor VIII isoform X1 [Oncorhynchus mykiss]|uniref:Coagulation factor VIII, procoagulant component n=3 Tax=Oncorhynchus mykiss TaxID=8022 RepID=A0A8K9WQD0_ONCMY|nr:coagulation factor VIII isoform X1 [Oncorhynchus mykiss]